MIGLSVPGAPARARTRGRRAPVLAVVSAKGGVGGSVCAAMLGDASARRARRTLLCDADANFPNLHVLLGAPAEAPWDALHAGECHIGEMVRVVAPNLWLLAGDVGAGALDETDAADRARLYRTIASTFDDFDAVVVDAGAGIEGAVRVATIRAGRLLVVTTTEPAGLTDTYALIKGVTLRAPGVSIDVIANRCLDEAEGPAAYVALAAACRQFLGREIGLLAALPEDPAIRTAVRDPLRFLRSVSKTAAANALAEAEHGGPTQRAVRRRLA